MCWRYIAGGKAAHYILYNTYTQAFHWPHCTKFDHTDVWPLLSHTHTLRVAEAKVLWTTDTCINNINGSWSTISNRLNSCIAVSMRQFELLSIIPHFLCIKKRERERRGGRGGVERCYIGNSISSARFLKRTANSESSQFKSRFLFTILWNRFMFAKRLLQSLNT